MADENEKSKSSTPGEDSAAPEVEAEIVTNDDPAAVFEDHDATDRVTDVNGRDAPPQKTSTLTPGVILFIVFAAFALAVFAFWRIQPGGSAQSAGASKQAPDAGPSAIVQDRQSPDDVEAGGDAPGLQPEHMPRPQTRENVGDAVADPASSDVAAEKVENNDFTSLEDKPDLLEPVKDPAIDDGVYLPPLPSDKTPSDDIQNMRQEAKETFRLADPAQHTTPGENDDQTSGRQSDEITGFDLEGVDPDQSSDAVAANNPADASDAELSETLASDGALASVGREIAPADNEINQNNKVANDLAALKATYRAETIRLENALEDERQRSAALREEIEALRRNFQAALDARSDQADEERAEMQARLDKIRNEEIAPAARRFENAMALKALAQAIDQGNEYSEELNRLEQAAPAAPAIEVLRKYAATGVATSSALKARFGAAARAGLVAAGREQASGFWGALSAQARNLISVRPANPQAGDSPRAVISRAEHAVEGGDLELALAQLELMPASSRVAMSEWVSDARARIEAEQALEALNGALLGQLSR